MNTEKQILERLLDEIKRGMQCCSRCADNPLNTEPLKSYYRGKAKAFCEVLGFYNEIITM